ncbi:rhythmically expressed gene 5 protein [Scaptodrosophila lebanonensis]|uniref:Rhythmically expressed gene 5 protein n=1 Tax=Drosophila lebanonensis TaxID=7225 RepID=A0A6J2TU96_DROLE|nr:rhythmically expressed gene 5 protein [Scaptodrosophila lebanonensis]
MAAAKALLAGCLLCAFTMQMCSTSSIPIWEFLTRNEKMSYLYSTFAQLVSVHCKSTAPSTSVPVNQCKHNLLGYGYEKLQTLSDEQLETLDPYQRDANELIWSSIMREHPSATLVTTRKPLPTPPASSLIILTHQKAPQQPVQNPLFDSSASEQNHKYAMDMDIAYGYGNNNNGNGNQPSATTSSELPEAAALTAKPPKTTSYLTGPLVIRVHPDGVPVEEDKYRPLPRDDDLDLFRLSSGSAASVGNLRPVRHRKIATINALKQQHFASIALQRELQPPHVLQRRQFRQTQPSPSGYYYGRAQA